MHVATLINYSIIVVRKIISQNLNHILIL